MVEASNKRCAILAALLSLPFASEMVLAADGVDLRLESSLAREQLPEVSDPQTEALLRFGASDVRRRIQRSRDRVRELRQHNDLVAEQVRAHERLIRQLKTLNDMQDRTVRVLRSAVSGQQAPPPQSQPLSTRPSVERASSPVVEPAPAFGRSESPATGWIVNGVLAALVVILLGWILFNRREPAALAQTPHPQGPAAPVGQPPRGVVRPAASPAPRAREPAPARPELVGKTANAAPAVKPEDGVAELAPDRALEPLHEDAKASTDSPVGRSPRVAAHKGVDTLVGFDLGVSSGAPGSQKQPSTKAADPQVLKEVDTLIAFEHYHKAELLLNQVLEDDPQNPEYLLRHYHVRTQGGVETADGDEELLRAMMDGPMSDTIIRVKAIGKGLMPGNPLFHDDAERATAARILAGEATMTGSTDVGGDSVHESSLSLVDMDPTRPANNR